MKQTPIIGILMVTMNLSLLPDAVFGQSELLFSNMDATTELTEAVAADRWLGSRFITGSNPAGYRLNAIHLSMGETTGNPGGIRVSLHLEGNTSDTGAGPGSEIADLQGPSPADEGIYIYDPTGMVVLSPQRQYYVVATSEALSNEGSYHLNIAFEGGIYHSSSNGSQWETGPRNYKPQFAVYATPIPTPAVSINATDDQIELRWEGFEGIPYQLQTRSSLTDTEWTDVGGPLTGDGSEITVPVPVNSGESQSYYRVEVLPAEQPANE